MLRISLRPLWPLRPLRPLWQPGHPLATSPQHFSTLTTAPVSASEEDDSGWRRENRVRKVWRVENHEAFRGATAAAVPMALEGLPCVAVLGRTNCGKSSLLNALFGKGHSQRAKASSRAGRTDAVEVFAVNEAFALADMPGHSGYDDATVPKDGHRFAKAWKGAWGPLVHGFLKRFAPPKERRPPHTASEGDDDGKGGGEGEGAGAGAGDKDDVDRAPLASAARAEARTEARVPGCAGLPPSFGLHGALFLCDVRWKCSDEDGRLLASLAKLRVPTLVVFTKDDRVAADLARHSKAHAKRLAAAGSDPLARKTAAADVHHARKRLVARRLTELGWGGPFVHFTCADPGAVVEGGLLSPRRCRSQLRRYVNSLCREGDNGRRHALLEAASPGFGGSGGAGGAGDDAPGEAWSAARRTARDTLRPHLAAKIIAAE